MLSSEGSKGPNSRLRWRASCRRRSRPSTIRVTRSQVSGLLSSRASKRERDRTATQESSSARTSAIRVPPTTSSVSPANSPGPISFRTRTAPSSRDCVAASRPSRTRQASLPCSPARMRSSPAVQRNSSAPSARSAISRSLKAARGPPFSRSNSNRCCMRTPQNPQAAGAGPNFCKFFDLSFRHAEGRIVRQKKIPVRRSGVTGISKLNKLEKLEKFGPAPQSIAAEQLPQAFRDFFLRAAFGLLLRRLLCALLIAAHARHALHHGSHAAHAEFPVAVRDHEQRVRLTTTLQLLDFIPETAALAIGLRHGETLHRDIVVGEPRKSAVLAVRSFVDHLVLRRIEPVDLLPAHDFPLDEAVLLHLIVGLAHVHFHVHALRHEHVGLLRLQILQHHHVLTAHLHLVADVSGFVINDRVDILLFGLETCLRAERRLHRAHLSGLVHADGNHPAECERGIGREQRGERGG